MGDYVNQFLFGIYPYVCAVVFLLGSLIRFDREQYTWRSGSSQLLRRRQLRWGSNLFHAGILFLLAGHTVGMLTPHWAYEWLISSGAKQVVAMASGGVAGVLAFDHPAAWQHYDQNYVGRDYFRVEEGSGPCNDTDGGQSNGAVAAGE